jgi:flagellar biosynthetic protein FliP
LKNQAKAILGALALSTATLLTPISSAEAQSPNVSNPTEMASESRQLDIPPATQGETDRLLAPTLETMGLTGLSTPSLSSASVPGTPSSPPLFSLSIGSGDGTEDLAPALRVVALITLLTFAPAILLLMSSFTRILLVLSFLRQAIGVPTMPPNQVLVGLALFMSYFVMAPTLDVIYETAAKPYMEKQITAVEAADRASLPIKTFMLKQTRSEDLKLFYRLGNLPRPTSKEDVSMRALVPAFVISELKSAFQIGFLVYLPFIVIDMIVSSVLMAMGMMMLPPTVVSLPLKLVLFVLVDGWNLLTNSLISSFI